MQPYGDNFTLVIFSDDELQHTDTSPFCYDATCPCHENQVPIEQVNIYVQAGLLTPEEATRTVKGGMV